MSSSRDRVIFAGIAAVAAGWTRTDRKYLEFVDANVFCGIGGFAGDTRKTDANRSNTGPEYARADNGCWTAGVAAHEIGHTLGAVNNNAPNGSGFAHCLEQRCQPELDAAPGRLHRGCPEWTLLVPGWRGDRQRYPDSPAGLQRTGFSALDPLLR